MFQSFFLKSSVNLFSDFLFVWFDAIFLLLPFSVGIILNWSFGQSTGKQQLFSSEVNALLLTAMNRWLMQQEYLTCQECLPVSSLRWRMVRLDICFTRRIKEQGLDVWEMSCCFKISHIIKSLIEVEKQDTEANQTDEGGRLFWCLWSWLFKGGFRRQKLYWKTLIIHYITH